MKFLASEDSHAAVDTGLMTSFVSSRRTMLSIANETKRGSLPEKTRPFVGLHSNFLKNQNVGLSGCKMFQSTPTARCSANIHGCDAKGPGLDASPMRRPLFGSNPSRESTCDLVLPQMAQRSLQFLPESRMSFQRNRSFETLVKESPLHSPSQPPEEIRRQRVHLLVKCTTIHCAGPGGKMRTKGHNMMSRFGRCNGRLI